MNTWSQLVEELGGILVEEGVSLEMGLEISIARAIPSFPVTSLCVVLADQRSALGYYPSALSV